MEQNSISNNKPEPVDLRIVAPASLKQYDYTAHPQPGSVLQYWHAIRGRKLLLAGFALAGLALGIGCTLIQVPTYRATTSIEIQDDRDDNLAKMLNLRPNDPVTPDSLSGVQTQIRILQSKTLVARALAKAHILSSGNLTRQSRWSLPSRAPESSAMRYAALIEQVGKQLKVSAVPDTRIVEVTFDASDPVVAARFVNTLTAQLIEDSLESRLQMNRQTSDFLIKQVDELRNKLQKSQDNLQAYARSNGLIYSSDRQVLSQEKLRELQTELSQAQADRFNRESRFEVARSAAPGSIPEALNDSNLRSMENNLVDLRKQEAEMAVNFKPDYSKRKMLQAQIESLESSIQKKRSVILLQLDNELKESELRESLLAGSYAKQTRLVTDDSEKSIQYDMLRNEVDTNRQIYQVMLQRVKESSIASALKATNVRVIDAAIPPLRRYKPILRTNAGIGLLLGLLCGMATVVIRSKTNASVQEPGDAGTFLGIPELGVIPAVNLNAGRNSLLFGAATPQKQLGSLPLGGRGSAAYPGTLSDSFRAVIASILFAFPRGRTLVLVITSPSPGEGKTSASSNMALTLANMGRRVLLIDGDIRSPRVHSIFQLENATGLTTMLKHLSSEGKPAQEFIQKTFVPNLHVLTAGPATQSGADMLFSDLMPDLIARFKNEYDMVLIDTAPMLVIPDARVLSRLADAVVLIARAGRTNRSTIQAAYKRFVDDQTPVLGVVLNDWDSTASAYRHYAAYKSPELEQASAVTIEQAKV